MTYPYTKALAMDNLTGEDPAKWLLHHGPTKLLLTNYHWHLPNAGIVASYTPNAEDVKDHFEVFRGVDQIESFAQAAVGSCSVFLECIKQNSTPQELKKILIPGFTSIGQVNFHSYLEKGDTFVNIGHIKSYKFRQMVCSGRIYKAPSGLNLDDYFADFTEERLLNYGLDTNFTLIAGLNDITGRSIKTELFKKQ